MNRYENLRKAFDASANTSPVVHLTQEQASAFVDLVVDQSQILSKLRIVKMDAAKMNIGRILSGGRFLQPGGQDVELGDDKTYKPKTDTINLTTKEFIGKIEIHDDEIKHNIEGAGLENTLLGHVAKKLRNELVELIFFSDTTGNFGAGMDAFKVLDGVFKKLTGKAWEVDFTAGFTDQYASAEKFRKMIKTLPDAYRSEAEFFLSGDIMMDYNAQFDNNVNRDDFINKILTKNTNEIPLFGFDSDGHTKTLLTSPNNIIVGIQVEDASMQFEKERIPGKRKTAFHYSIELDVNVEIPEAAVVGNKMKSR